MTPESKIKAAYNKREIACPHILTHPYFAGAYGHKFVPDRIGVATGGRFVGIEFKTPKGRVSVGQAGMMQRIEALGGKCFVVRNDDDIDEVIAWASR